MPVKDNFAYIARLCQQLAASGITPTVAKIRNRSQRPLAMKDVIQTLQRWKQDPAQFEGVEETVNESEQSLPEGTLESRVCALEQEVTQLKNQLNALLAERSE